MPVSWPNPYNVLGGLEQSAFLEQYWQKKPLLVRGAFTDFTSPVGPDDLAGLACEENVNARIVRHDTLADSWAVEYSPFDESTFKDLPESNWALLVSDAEKAIPGLAEILDCFRFIPDWRIDDVMISYATDGGSIGPHLDAYDVFLLQAEGSRLWQINSEKNTGASFRKDSELSILEEFHPDEEWLLQPGDMLYLPPGIAHHGVAQGECMTWSIGFRAPSTRDMLVDYTNHIVMDLDKNDLYTDPDLNVQESPSEISASALGKARALIEKHMHLNSDFNTWFGKFLTESKSDCLPITGTSINSDDLVSVLQSDSSLTRNPAMKMAFIDNTVNAYADLFIDGSHFSVPREFAIYISDSRHLENRVLLQFIKDPNSASAMQYLASNNGFLTDDEP